MISALSSGLAGMQQAGAELERGAGKLASGDPAGAADLAVAVATMKASTTMERCAAELIGATLHVVA